MTQFINRAGVLLDRTHRQVCRRQRFFGLGDAHFTEMEDRSGQNGAGMAFDHPVHQVLGIAEEGEVPVTFATRALTEPAVLKDLQAILGAQVPVHIAQAFEVTEALKAGQGYKVAMVLEAMRDEHMRLTGTFTGPSGGVCVVMRSEFLLVQPVALK